MVTAPAGTDQSESLDREALIPDVGSEVSILHIEDDAAFAELVSNFLQRERDSFEVLTETDPRDGIKRVENERIDCVISDYDMPEMNGLGVLKEVRKKHPQLPFILFTGKGSEEIASEAISAGVTDYLQKRKGTEQYGMLANRVEQAVARRRAEKQVERGFNAIETANDGISLLNDTGEFIYVNEAYAKIVGYERDELLGEHFETIYPDNDIDFVYEEMIPEAKEGEWTGTTVYERKDGDVITVEHSISYTTGDTMICTISESDEEVREALSLREQAMDEAPIGIVITDADREDNPIIYANDGFAEVTGYSREETVGRNCRFLQGEETREEPIAEMRDAIDAAESVAVELRNYRKNGEMFWNRVTIAPLFDDSGDVDYFVGCQEDVTARREIMAEYGSLGSVLSHDLQNPLQTVRGRLELAIETGNIDHVEEAIPSVDRLEALTNDIASVLQTGTITPKRDYVSVERAAESVWESREDCHDESSLEVVDSPAVTGNRGAIGRMMDNLIGNSIEHGEPPVTIRVGGLEDGFYVEDDGPGIPEGNREKVFEQGFSTKESGDETGVGMTSVRQIVLAHGWRITITDSEELGGVRFEIRTE